MTVRVLIIGGYGNFGTFIARSLATDTNIHLIIAGRNVAKAQSLATELKAEWTALDVHGNLDIDFQKLKPDIVIHTSGPFQQQNYDVTSACIRNKCHYIDLADGRDFVCNITSLDELAKDAGVMVVSGASSVPCLTSAILDHYQPEFRTMEEIDYGITTAQRTNPGVATTAAILGYTGKPFTTLINGKMSFVYGWQNLASRTYPELGRRWLGNCDVPDLALFPDRYPDLKTIRFRAGLDVPLLHFGLWGLSWLVRWRILPNLRPLAPVFAKAARYFDVFGSDRSGFHMEIKGTDHNGAAKKLTFYLLTGSGHGPNIPCIPAILTAKAIASGENIRAGAYPCLGMIKLEDYLKALEPYDIKWRWEVV